VDEFSYPFFFNYQHFKRLIYTSCGTGIFIFKPLLGRVIFSLTFPWTSWFANYRFWDGLQFFLPFNSRFLDVDGQKLCENLALSALIQIRIILKHLSKNISKIGDTRKWQFILQSYLFNTTLDNTTTSILWHKFRKPNFLVQIYLYTRTMTMLIRHS
jgi:hypothetical protein